jgi:hypothetical protein
MVVDYNYIIEKQTQRQNRITSVMHTRDISQIEAAMWVDMNSPYTTNRKQLAQAGYDVEEVDEWNLEDILDSLQLMGIEFVIAPEVTRKNLIKQMNSLLDDEIPEFWGGEGVTEVVRIFPAGNTENDEV